MITLQNVTRIGSDDEEKKQPKGKQGTKGAKQIAEENKSTLSFYRNISFGVNALYVVLQYILFWESFTALYIFLFLLALCAHFGCYQFLAYMGKGRYTTDGHLIDPGIDLNMESGMAEHAKDVILFTSIVQGLSIISNYFWLLLLVIPGRAFYMLWVNILAPWIFAPAPEVDEKKLKKRERKAARRQ
ncbi:hypothetical protein FSP39_000941 [Pinctada imbricata]|uniref:Transmembrane protein 208 n=1 Tax=Pinctada imbricata TaxID=66713 RepID=A0AA89BL98_PINIB|nr:hypothetical protein FSP39_000941 [Pinctada imbricata]